MESKVKYSKSVYLVEGFWRNRALLTHQMYLLQFLQLGLKALSCSSKPPLMRPLCFRNVLILRTDTMSTCWLKNMSCFQRAWEQEMKIDIFKFSRLTRSRYHFCVTLNDN